MIFLVCGCCVSMDEHNRHRSRGRYDSRGHSPTHFDGYGYAI